MTELPYLISDEALGDVTGIAIWYETKRLFLSDQFLKEFYTVSLPAISSSFKSFRKANKNSNIRRYKMNRFPYKIFYDNRTLPIKIIAVIHTSRSSGYIKRRLK
jgi:plasmid stabilization system protein ParE